jgi:hypothetical protein
MGDGYYLIAKIILRGKKGATLKIKKEPLRFSEMERGQHPGVRENKIGTL